MAVAEESSIIQTMRMRLVLAVSVTGLLIWSPKDVTAHIAMTSPTPRCSSQKAGPCGERPECRDRGATVAVFEPGQTITIRWNEFIGHPSHYRIAFDEDGDDAFVDPVTEDDIVTPPVLPVLLDGILDMTGTGPREATVTLPDIECETCTLQLIQVMKDKPPFGNGDDIYYQCADISLRIGAGDAGPGGPDAGSEDPDGGASMEDAGLLDAGPSGADGSADMPGTPSPPDDDGCDAVGGGSFGSALALLALLAFVSMRRRTVPGRCRAPEQGKKTALREDRAGL